MERLGARRSGSDGASVLRVYFVRGSEKLLPRREMARLLSVTEMQEMLPQSRCEDRAAAESINS